MNHYLKPYPSYKETGDLWLGVVPSHWVIKPFRGIFEEVRDPNHPEEPMLSVTISRGVILQSDLLNNSSQKDSSNSDKTKYKLVIPGDIAYNKMRAWQGAIGMSDYRGIISPAYIVQRPRKGINPKYMHYLLRTPGFAAEAERYSYGITSDMWSLRSEHFKLINGCVPTSEEQEAIVRFLDYANQRIRHYIRNKQKLIKLLEEQKQALIHRAVTRGLDPDVPMKDSGVEWLGEIPAHWETRRAKYIFNKVDIRSKTGEEELLSVSSKDGVVPRSSKKVTMFKAASYIGHKLCWPKDLVINSLWAWANGLGFSKQHGIISSAYGVYRLKSGYEYLWQYLDYLLRSDAYDWQFNVRSKGIWKSRLQLTDVAFFEIPIVIPPKEEISKIISHIEDEIQSIEILINSNHGEIELLKEIRMRLIADIITGKVDVSEIIDQLPEIIPEIDLQNEEEHDEDIDDLEGDSADDEIKEDF